MQQELINHLFLKKTDLANFSNLKSNVDKLGVDKLVLVPGE